MARGRAFNVAVLMLGLLVMAQHSMQHSLKDPSVKSNSNCKGLQSKLGLVFTSARNEEVLNKSGLFIPDPTQPYVDIAGRRYHIGSIYDHPTVYVKTGTYSVNAALAVQALIDNFVIHGIVHFGNAATLNDTVLPVGYVTVPAFVSFTAAWEWRTFESSGGQLQFGEFNYPQNGENLLGSVNFQNVPILYSPEEVKQDFYVPVPSDWLTLATDWLKDLELARCYFGVCLPRKPKVEFGLRASTSEFRINNKAYGEYLYQNLNVSSTDQATAGVVLAALSNGKPVIAFRGVSNSVADGSNDRIWQITYLANSNALKAAATFIKNLPTPYLACPQ